MDCQRKTLLFILALVPLISADGNKMEIFETSRIVPDVISEPPPMLAKVSYGNITIETGTKITSEQSQQMPCVKWESDDDIHYTLIMIDPDIPKEIPAKEIIHWLVVNIPKNDITNGTTLFEYIGCTPPKGNPAHRYVFLIYKQDEKFYPENYANLTDEKKGRMMLRMKTEFKHVTNQLKLKMLIAGNFHTTIYDENVPRYWNATFEKYD